MAWLLHEGMLGGFHFNDRKYADDDLTLGSIDPYQVFRIFHEILSVERSGKRAEIAYMIDQSHNLKGKMEAMVQTVVTAQELFAKAALVDHKRLRSAAICDLVAAEGLCRMRLQRCAAGDPRMAKRTGACGRSSGRFPAERIPGANYPRAGAKERRKRFDVCLADPGKCRGLPA